LDVEMSAETRDYL